jgi:hypothetical protein
MKKQTMTVIGLTLLMAWGAQANQERLALSIKEARMEADKTAEQLKATLTSLNGLTKQTKGDLRPAYNTFVSEVAKTEKDASVTRSRALWMEGDGRRYFQDWQKTVDSIGNESLRKKAQKRLDNVKKNFDEVETSMKEAAEKFKPFLADLGDVQKTLAADVTPGGVKAIKGTVSSANWDHKFVKKGIDNALSGMKKMERELSPEASK